ncbi:MAG: hypothetical protein P8H65_00375 [Rhodothermales bacterium]|jgi:hypothetical protein|nr:hypothetical protein [Rhodothermales bacterium]MDG2016365.1 hypothetical protein [Rhodothermales bacterium]
MRGSILTVILVASLAMSIPAQAQLRTATPANQTAVRLYDQGGSGFSLNRLFSPTNFQMSHSFEMSSFSGGSTLSMYTNSMNWKFNKIAARLDVSAAYSPMQNQSGASVTGQTAPQVFIRNADIAYRPTKNMQFNLSLRRSPYGSYMSPYGRGGYGMGYDSYGGSSMYASFGPSGGGDGWLRGRNR